jgi:hypothetical protein
MRATHPSAVDPSRLLELIDRFTKVRVAVFGDLIVDEFIYGDIARVSREAPVLILNYDSTEIVRGEPATRPTMSPRSAEPRRRLALPAPTRPGDG